MKPGDEISMLSRNHGTIKLTLCPGCRALMGATNRVCLRCEVEGTPALRREGRAIRTINWMLIHLLHFPVMITFRICLYYFLHVPLWLWLFFVAESLVWLACAVFSLFGVFHWNDAVKQEEKMIANLEEIEANWPPSPEGEQS